MSMGGYDKNKTHKKTHQTFIIVVFSLHCNSCWILWL